MHSMVSHFGTIVMEVYGGSSGGWWEWAPGGTSRAAIGAALGGATSVESVTRELAPRRSRTACSMAQTERRSRRSRTLFSAGSMTCSLREASSESASLYLETGSTQSYFQ